MPIDASKEPNDAEGDQKETKGMPRTTKARLAGSQREAETHNRKTLAGLGVH